MMKTCQVGGGETCASRLAKRNDVYGMEISRRSLDAPSLPTYLRVMLSRFWYGMI